MTSLNILILILLQSLASFAQKDSSKLFELSKGKWPLPIEKYTAIYDNENLKHFTSNQFDSILRIVTDSSYRVRAVHDGRVIKIFEVKNEYTVVTEFGSYCIVYSRLTKPDIVEGEFIRAGIELGQLFKNWTEKNFTLEIMLYDGGKQIRPIRWIKW